MDENALQLLDAIIQKALDDAIIRKDSRAYPALTEWQDIKELYRKYPEVEEERNKLEQQTVQLTEPPLDYAIYLGPSTADPSYLVVGIGGNRKEVRGVQGTQIEATKLLPGQLVTLNKEQSITDVRNEYICGETAEVVNVIVGEEEATVLAVDEKLTGQPMRLRVRWREKEEITVTCSEQLVLSGVQRDDIVRIDPDQKLAIAKARPRLHVRAGGNDGIVVEISDNLVTQGVHVGDIVRIESGLKFAFEKLPVTETGKLTLEDVPDVTYDDVGGLDEQISQIYDTIEMPYLFREQFERYQLVRPKGILLYGPPGCGKTMVAKAVANSLTKNIRNHLTDLEQRIVLYRQLQQHPDDPDLVQQYNALLSQKDAGNTTKTGSEVLESLAQYLSQYSIDLSLIDDELHKIRAILAKKDGVRSFFLNVKGPELLDKYVGETEHRIRKIFEEARRHSSYYTPVIIFFDEMEAMFRTRGSGRSSDVETTIVPQFLAEIDGVESLENLVIIGASNRQDMIDPAIMRPGRLDVKIKVARPDLQSARDIFAMYLLPTLPLNAEDVILPEPEAQPGPGEIVFRTAYRTPKGTNQQGIQGTQGTQVQAIGQLEQLLPPGCDLRLARSLSYAEMEELALLPSKSTLREILANNDSTANDVLRRKLRRFKTELPVGELLRCLHVLDQQYISDQAIHRIIDFFIQQEWLAETLLLRSVALLYSPASTISMLTSPDGSRYSFPLKDFMSGAVIANIVTRAKRQSIKRVALTHTSEQDGITLQDLFGSIRQEFEENKEQLAQNKIQSEMGKVAVEVHSVELNIETGESDPWSEEKIVLYKVTAPLRA